MASLSNVKKPIKLYFFVTVLLVIGIILVGVMVRNFLDKKFSSKSKGQKEITKEQESPEIRLAKLIWSLASILFLILISLYAISKITKQQSKIEQ